MFEIEEDIEFIDSKYRLIIKRDLLQLLKKYEQIGNRFESGGILIGLIYKGHIEIKEITVPGKLDRLGQFFFIRSKNGAQSRINKAWKKTTGALNYLGEWHTHPIQNPTPSQDDRKMIKKQLKETKMEIDFLFLLIVGQNDTYWVGRQTHQGLAKMRRKF